MCGFEFDETQIENRGCSSCGKHNCNAYHCPNCGFANSPELDEEFENRDDEFQLSIDEVIMKSERK